MIKCLICEEDVKKEKNKPSEGMCNIDCPTCGQYAIAETVSEILRKDQNLRNNKYILSGVIREATKRGKIFEITSSDDLNTLIESASVPSDAIEAMNRILLYVERTASGPGAFATLMSKDYPIIFAKNAEEFTYYLENLLKRSLLEEEFIGKYRLTIKGWERAIELHSKETKSDQAFVAMWFTDELEPAWKDGLEPALDATGYNPIRIKNIEHNEKVDDRIIAEIRRSGLLVADFTGNRGGVYFEAGFAMGLGIPVIWTCREDDVGKLHFDTRQYNHITWKNPEDLREKLINRIEATIVNRPKHLEKQHIQNLQI